ncbi:MAG: ABC transporter ATP-binding protein [Candidatus Korarchaeum sp.]|nr:ABC transporter ATP-binding protein [Candidatus Korarchaeum sp.]
MEGVVRILIKDLIFSYKHGFSLKNITLDVKNKEIITLLGPNGSGKTTLLKCINKLLVPQVRCLYIDGKDIIKMKQNDLAKLVGYVPQTHHPVFPYSVYEVILMGRAPHIPTFQQPSEADFVKVNEILETIGLYDIKERPYTELSGGERQLVLIARALVQEPQVLLLDEPSAHLDFRNQLLVLRTIKKIVKQRDITVIMSLHDPNLALLFSDRVVLMKNGEIVACGVPDKVITPENIKDVYGVDVKVIREGGRKFVLPAEDLAEEVLEGSPCKYTIQG